MSACLSPDATEACFSFKWVMCGRQLSSFPFPPCGSLGMRGCHLWLRPSCAGVPVPWGPAQPGTPAPWDLQPGVLGRARCLQPCSFSNVTSHASLTTPASPVARGHKSNLMISLKGFGGWGGGKICFLPSARVLYEILWGWAKTLRPFLGPGEGTFSSSLPARKRGPPQYSFCSAVAAVGAPAPENRPF